VSKRLDPKKVVTLARGLVSLFETAVEPLQKALEVIPAPTLEEVAEMRRRVRPLTPAVYLLGFFHRSLLAAENLASDFRELDLKTLGKVHKMELSEVEFNEIEQAVAERRKKP
jgi:hypothetical protein